jgi:hypothetical protein
MSHLALRRRDANHSREVNELPESDESTETLIIRTLFRMNAKLADIREDVAAIRAYLEEDDGEEEEEDLHES